MSKPALGDRPATKRDRREQARRDRAELQRRIARRRRLWGLAVRIVVLGVAGGALLLHAV